MERLHLIIQGRVQGVFFRDSTHRMATRHGLVGWVRNRPDRSVEVVAEGPHEALLALEAWCHHGPPAASVTRVDVTWLEATGEFPFFRIIH